MTLANNVAPSGNFDLRNWKLTLPVDSGGGFSGTAVEIKSLQNYQNLPYFYTAIDGAMVFAAPVEGATTSGSSFARSELREMNGTAKAAWNLTQGGFMRATLEIDAAPIRDGVGGRLVVGQIHGQDHELVRLYWENSTLYFVNDQAGADNADTKFYFLNDLGQQPNVSLNERFSYTIKAKGGDLEVTIFADSWVYKSVTTINAVWQSDAFYFKAGAYLGANEMNGSGYGQASFYALEVTHDSHDASSTGRTQAFRFYNTQTQSHFYTASAAEKEQVIASYPQFVFEGNAFDTTATALNGIEVFRFYNTQTRTHFYTASAVERDIVIATYAQFQFEGTAYYAHATDGGGQHEALYRFYNEQTKTHFYTASELERDQVMAQYAQYKYEGIAYYVDLA